MSTRARKRKAANPGARSGLRSDVQEAIARVWPDDIVELPFDLDESYFWGIHLELSRAFQRMQNARLVQEYEAEGGPIWWGESGSDPDEDPPDEIGHSRSYHRFFVSPEGTAFTFETEAEGIEPEFMTEEFEEAGWADDALASRIPGSGRIGWVVAVSLLEPLAVIEFGDVVSYEDGSTTEAEIESCAHTVDGEPIRPEEQLRKYRGTQAYKRLVSLREKISGLLEKTGITVLPAEEWRKPVPWLRSGEECLIGLQGKPIRVLDAFFFQAL